MITFFSMPSAIVLMAFTASGYALATVGMKMASGGVTSSALALISIGLLCAVLAEIFLLRHADLEVIYIGIVVLESFLVLAYAAYTGGALTMPQVLGASMALAGFALVSVGT